MIKLVAFDWNGTILDDTEAGVVAESAVRVHFGFKETTLEEMQEHFQIPIRQYWLNAGLPPDFFDSHSAEIDKSFMENYEPLEAKCNLRSGTEELLKWLDVEKIDSVIFSNHIVPHIDKQTTRLGVRNYFKSILARPVSGDLTHHGKTFKDQLLKKHVESNSFAPNQVIIIGDTMEEIEIGKKLGYHAVALSGGWQSIPRLESAKPEYLINNLAELKNIIQRINGRTNPRN